MRIVKVSLGIHNMFIEVRYTCRVSKLGYYFDEFGGVRPIGKKPEFIFKPLEEIAIFELTDLFEALDPAFKTGTPNMLEQTETLRFYNRWGFIQLQNTEAESSPILLRALKDFWFTDGFAPLSVDIKQYGKDLVAEPKLLVHALALMKTRLDETMYATCKYFELYGEQRPRRGPNSGACPPKCRVKKQQITKANPNGNSWGRKCQKVHDNRVRRATQKGVRK